MEHSTEPLAIKQFSLEEVLEATVIRLDAEMAYARHEYALYIANNLLDGDVIIDGAVHSEGRIMPIPQDADVLEGKNCLNAVDEQIRNSLGLDEDIDISELRRVARQLDLGKRSRNKSIGDKHSVMPSYQIPWADTPEPVPNFLKATQALASITGEPIYVYINKYRQVTELITANTDISDVIKRAKQLDKDGCKWILDSKYFDETEKQQHSLEIVDNWYTT